MLFQKLHALWDSWRSPGYKHSVVFFFGRKKVLFFIKVLEISSYLRHSKGIGGEGLGRWLGRDWKEVLEAPDFLRSFSVGYRRALMSLKHLWPFAGKGWGGRQSGSKTQSKSRSSLSVQLCLCMCVISQETGHWHKQSPLWPVWSLQMSWLSQSLIGKDLAGKSEKRAAWHFRSCMVISQQAEFLYI